MAKLVIDATTANHGERASPHDAEFGPRPGVPVVYGRPCAPPLEAVACWAETRMTSGTR